MTSPWRLREIMAARGLNNIADLVPLLTERGIMLSALQIYRLVGDRPERLSLTRPGALIDALACTVEDLCAFRVEADAATKAVDAGPVVVDRTRPSAPGCAAPTDHARTGLRALRAPRRTTPLVGPPRRRHHLSPAATSSRDQRQSWTTAPAGSLPPCSPSSRPSASSPAPTPAWSG
ncbi:helix-turn-helix domain-containing protein [Actinoplanes philippinensis]|uniref:helix-turn-helix domain-containing protein n=1 Tax=Actinoplanes philippinensis TaxID=35752 RepID=UPI0033D28792